MTKTSLGDLNDHLFDQMNRLSNSELTGEALQAELDRSSSMVAVADRITANAKVTLDAAKLYASHGAQVLPHLPQIAKQSGEDTGGTE